MASLEGQTREASSYSPPNQYSMPLSMTHNSTLIDDSEEWEYEYSTTETETYYLTLDLTTPSIPCARPPLPKPGRGGYRPTWINPGRRRQRRHLELAPTISLPKAGVRASVSTPTPTPAIPSHDEDSVKDASDEGEEVQEQQEPIQNNQSENGGATQFQDPPAVQKPERLQILDLHTENPIVTYKSHAFSCRWAENIGTELLFTFRDPAKSLPVLRSLPDNVDLLAASSARLISKSVKMVPKTQVKVNPDTEYTGYGTGNPRRRCKKPRGIIPVGSGASDSRREQARFLERIMEIKHRKGEKDAVTVVAQRRLYPAGWRAVVKEKRGEERAKLRSMVRKGGDDAKAATKRLEEMDREDKVMAEEVKVKKANVALRKSKPGRKPKEVDGQGYTKRTKGISFGRRPRGGRAKFKLFQADSINSTPIPKQENNEQTLVSTPTPQRWNELDDNEPEVDDEDMPDV